MAEEKQFVIPLRKEFQKGPSYKKSEKAIKAIREFIMRHMKTDSVKIGRNLNLKIFEHGRKNPPPKIKIKAIKEENIVRVELPEFPFETKVEKKESKTKKSEKAPEKIEEIKEVKQETKTETKEIKVEAKKEEKLEVKEVIEKPTEEKLDKEKSKKPKK